MIYVASTEESKTMLAHNFYFFSILYQWCRQA